jgi:hypothetical protein
MQGKDAATTMGRTRHAFKWTTRFQKMYDLYQQPTRERQPCAKQQCTQNNQTRSASNGPLASKICII